MASYVEDSAAPRVKFLSSIGGNIEQTLEGTMHYRGGETRLLIFYRDITYADLMFKIPEYYLMPVSFKYQVSENNIFPASYMTLCHPTKYGKKNYQ